MQAANSGTTFVMVASEREKCADLFQEPPGGLGPTRPAFRDPKRLENDFN